MHRYIVSTGTAFMVRVYISSVKTEPIHTMLLERSPIARNQGGKGATYPQN